jgi:hypothetical protein
MPHTESDNAPARVFATVYVDGFHHWPGAPGAVAYLRDMHRHRFRFRVEAEVGHDNRDVEFHILAHHLTLHLQTLYRRNLDGVYLFGERSCETLARGVLSALPGVAAVEVWEDEDFGARVSR